MTGNKFDKACRLYLAMSELDDRTAAEALRYQKPASRSLRVALIMAACLTLLITSTLMGGIFARYVNNSADHSPDAPGITDNATTLSSVLNNHRQNDDDTSDSVKEPPELINITPAIIWKYQDSEEYHVKAINYTEFEQLLSEIKYGKPVAAEEIELDCHVWIASGNGEVYSPYLKPSDGNIGYGNLFEYDPELQPTEAFASAVSSLLN